MDNFGVMARIKEFDQRNGGNAVLFNGWYLYPNGATREEWPLGALIDPPANEYQRLTNIVSYHQGRLVNAIRKFDVFKEQLMMSDGSNAQGLEELSKLQRTVEQLNQAVLEAQNNLAETEEGQQRKRSRQQDAENRQMQAEFRDKVKAIRI